MSVISAIVDPARHVLDIEDASVHLTMSGIICAYVYMYMRAQESDFRSLEQRGRSPPEECCNPAAKTHC